MKIYLDPGKAARGAAPLEVQELRLELDDTRGGDDAPPYAVVLHVTEYRGSVLVTVTHGDPQWRPAAHPSARPLDLLVVDSYALPEDALAAARRRP